MLVYKVFQMFHPEFIINSNIRWKYLSEKPNATPILRQYITRVDIYGLAKNPNGFQVVSALNNGKVQTNTNQKIYINLLQERLIFQILSCNPNAIPILEQNQDKIDWQDLCTNPSAIHILEKNMEKINWSLLSMNPNAIHLLEQNLDKINYTRLSCNPNAIHILEQNQEKISWGFLSGNPNAIHLLEENLEKVNWQKLSGNPNAIHLLEQNLDKVHWGMLSTNPNAIHLLARLNTEKMRENCKAFAQELAEHVFHPLRLLRICEVYGLELDEYFELV